MLTVFTTPKSFKNSHHKLIQENAILSWKQISPDIEIILLSPDKEIVAVAKHLGVRAVTTVKKNKLGTPFLNSIFENAKQHSSYPLLLYTNSDIIFSPKDLRHLIKTFSSKKNFLLAGARWDLDIEKKIDFQDPLWSSKLKKLTLSKGRLHPPQGSDYFIFPKEAVKKLPPFLVGRVGWDNWFLHHAIKTGLKTIDVTPVSFVVHQNHDYKHQPGHGRNIETNPEALHNLRLLSPPAKSFTLKDLPYQLINNGLIKQRALSSKWNAFLVMTVCATGLLFLAIRWPTAKSGLLQIKTDMLNMLIYEKGLSADEKLLRLRGPSYIYIKHLREATPKYSDICISDQLGNDITPFIAASHLFPRHVSVIPGIADGPQDCQGLLLPINNKNPRFIVLYKDFPKFSLKAKKIHIFGPDLNSPIQTYENINYTPNSPKFNTQVGVIEL